MMHLPLYSNSRTRKFSDIWDREETFVNDYEAFNDGNNTFALNSLSDSSIVALYYLLYSRYGNSSVASADETRFKYNLFTIIFAYGPTWEKRLEIQSELRKMDLDELRKGGKAIYNTALNPSQPVSGGAGAPIGQGTNTLEELTYINQQNTTNYKKSKIDAYQMLITLLDTDVTMEFLDKFKKLFKQGVVNELPLYYVSEDTIYDGGDEE